MHGEENPPNDPEGPVESDQGEEESAPDPEFGPGDLDWGEFMAQDDSAVAEVVATGPGIGTTQGDALAIGTLITGAASTILAAAQRAWGEATNLPSVQLRPVEYPASVRLRFTLGEESLQLLEGEGITSPSIEAAKHVRDLVASVDEPDRLQGELLELGQGVATAYDRFLEAVAENDVEITWRARDVEEATMTSAAAAVGRGILDEPITETDPEPTRFVGRLERADARNKGFGIHLQTRWHNKYMIDGKYRPEVEAVIEEQGLWNQIVVATVQVSWVSKVKHPDPVPHFELIAVNAASDADLEG